jgi:hypothetical protein
VESRLLLHSLMFFQHESRKYPRQIVLESGHFIRRPAQEEALPATLFLYYLTHQSFAFQLISGGAVAGETEFMSSVPLSPN